MIVLMGGSGSTGSSLLKNILNRHPSVFAGEESNLFCKKPLYDDFSNAKNRIVERKIKGLKNQGWHIYNGVDLISPEYGLSIEKISKFSSSSDNFYAFCKNLNTHFKSIHDHTIWIEKTPANAANFDQFLHSFPTGKIIHMVRNPLDTIASLMNRGYSLYYATGIYLMNTAAGIKHLSNAKCCTIKYEDLINQPKETLAKLCTFLEITFQPDILKSQNEKIAVSQLPGWNYDETGDLGNKSLGRFERLNESKKNEILNAIQRIYINKKGKKYYDLEVDNIENISKILGYHLPEHNLQISATSLSIAKIKDRFNRMIRLYPSGLRYPLSIH